MQSPTPEVEARQVRLLSRLFLAAILAATLAGLVLGFVAEPTMRPATAWLIVAVLAVLAIVEYALLGGTLLPAAVAKPAARPLTTASLGYAFADAAAIYGCVGAILAGQGLVALPFGVFSVLTWQSVNSFLADTYRDILG